MAERIIAYCGLVCSECPAYVATQAGDMEALEHLAAEWGKEFNLPVAARDCLCDGCRPDSEQLCSFCHQCPVRPCAIERGVVTCAHCDDYGCERITGLFGFIPETKTALERIRQTL